MTDDDINNIIMSIQKMKKEEEFEMGERPPIKPEMERVVRKEAYYGCVRCGCPVIHIHHIEPWHIVKKHEKENLVPLCPNCHSDVHLGLYPKSMLIEDKKNPYNKKTRCVQKAFFLENYENFSLYMGGNRFQRVRNVLKVCGANIIYFNIDEKGRPLLNAIFFDEKGNLVAMIIDNIWKTFISDDMWDVSFSGGKLKINMKRNKVFLELITKGNEVTIDALMYYGNYIINSRNNSLKIKASGGRSFIFSGCEIIDGMNGIVLG